MGVLRAFAMLGLHVDVSIVGSLRMNPFLLLGRNEMECRLEEWVRRRPNTRIVDHLNTEEPVKRVSGTE
jgi:hypothetical protein